MAHGNTIFHQMLQFVSRHDFKQIEKDGFKPKRKYRRLDRWGQFCTMLFAQFTGQRSLRDLAGQMAYNTKKLYHLGLKPVKRSTLSDANNSRDAGFFEKMFDRQFQRCAALAPGHRFRFKNKLYSFDSSTVDLCLKLFPWASFRKTKAGIKLHTLVDHDGYLPCFVNITEAKVHDIQAAVALLTLPSNSIVAMDRGYVDFSLFNQLTKQHIYFVTRMKRRLKHTIVDRRQVLKNKGLTSDQTIRFTSKKGKALCPIELRKIGFRDPHTGKHYVFITNNFDLSARTIADIYKDRWQVELFFKWIKQNLKIKRFLGTRKNAVMTQVWVALIAMLLLAYLKFTAKFNQSLKEILRLIRLNLFDTRSVWRIFDDPSPPLIVSKHRQLPLFINDL